MGKKKNLYGTTRYGGAYNAGTVFEVTPSGTEKVLHSFEVTGTDGYYPYAGLIVDKKRNLYGTTYYGGAYGYGTVFELTPTGTETILHSFNYDGTEVVAESAPNPFQDWHVNCVSTTYRQAR